MREIEFRGKRIDDCEWVYGSLIRSDEWYGEIREKPKYYICHFTTTFEHDRCYKDSDEVSPETVGQYTGLKDKNGTKIFEGDNLKSKHNADLYNVYWEDSRFLIEDVWGNRIKPTQTAIKHFECEIVGNIYDNPELVNGE